MIAMFRLGLFLLLLSTGLYFLLALYFRSRTRMHLERAWDAAEGPGERTTFIRDGMERYSRSIRRRYLWVVVFVPYLLIMTLIYFLNFND